MAGGKNIGLGYRPLQGDISNDILNWEDQGFKHGQVKREEEARKAAALAAKQKKAQEALSKLKSINPGDTSSESLNEVLAKTAKIAESQIPMLYEITKDESGKYSSIDKVKAQLKLDYLESDDGFVSDLSKITGTVLKEYQDYQTGKAKFLAGKNGYFPDEEYESKFNNGYKNTIISLDDNLRPVLIFKKSDQDLNNDGVIDEKDVETMESLADINQRPTFNKYFNYGNLVKQHSEKLVSAVNTDANGFKTTTKTGLEIDLLNESVNRVLYKNDGTPTDVMKSLVREQGLSIDNPEDLKKIENTYKNDLLLRSKRGVEEKFDSGAYVSNKRLEQDNEKATLGETTTPTKQTYGIYNGNIEKEKVNSVNVQGSVVLPSVKTEKGEYVTNFKPHNITKDKFGRMVIEGSYATTKTETLTNDKYEKEMQTAVANEDFLKIALLKQAADVDGGKRVTVPGQNVRKDITISKEDETDVAGKLGYSVEELNKVIYKNPEDANKKIISGF